MSDALRSRLLLRGIVHGYRTKLLKAPPGSRCIARSHGTSVQRHTGPRYNVTSERQLVNFSRPAGDSNPQPVVITSITLYLQSYIGWFTIMCLWERSLFMQLSWEKEKLLKNKHLSPCSHNVMYSSLSGLHITSFYPRKTNVFGGYIGISLSVRPSMWPSMYQSTVYKTHVLLPVKALVGVFGHNYCQL